MSIKWFGFLGWYINVARASVVELAQWLQWQSFNIDDEEEEANFEETEERMNPMARSVMRSGQTMKLVIISLRAFKIFCFEMFVLF